VSGLAFAHYLGSEDFHFTNDVAPRNPFDDRTETPQRAFDLGDLTTRLGYPPPSRSVHPHHRGS
jgi:hypothetical protein